ncbi:MAG: hypothetical protein ACJAXM_001625 [Arenicella sp.]|jgi:hypothetical protein
MSLNQEGYRFAFSTHILNELVQPSTKTLTRQVKIILCRCFTCITLTAVIINTVNVYWGWE